MRTLGKNIRTSTLFLFFAGAAFALYGFFTDLKSAESKIAAADGGQCDFDADGQTLRNENAHLFVSCGGFLE